MPHFPLNIRVIAVGKMSGSHFAPAGAEYLARLQHYVTLEVMEVRTLLGQGKPEAQALLEEGRELLKLTRAEAKLFALHSAGKHFTSAAFAQMLQKQMDEGARKLDFVLGGANGLSPEVLTRSVLQLSLSQMTFAHELARVVLLEQLYRAGTILRGEKYHK